MKLDICVLQLLPRTASSRPSHFWRCVLTHVNGPLPVNKQSSSDSGNDGASMELLSPRLKAALALDSALSTSRLQSGQIGRAFFKARSQSLGDYLFLLAETG